ELAREQMSPEQRAERDRLYALNPDEVGDSGPSVVTINGVVASLACTEALMSSRSAVFLVFKARLHCGAVAEATRTGDVDVFLVFKARLHCGEVERLRTELATLVFLVFKARLHCGS